MKRLALVLMAVCGLCLSSCKAMCAESKTSEPGKAAGETPAKIETKPEPEKPAEEWKTPATKLSYAFGMEIGSALKGRCKVNAWLIALRSAFGADTATGAIVSSASTRFLSPGESIPSSFVTSIIRHYIITDTGTIENIPLELKAEGLRLKA